MAGDETTRETMSDAQLAQALSAYRECEATYLYPKSDDERERAAIIGFWNARNIIPALLSEVAQLRMRERSASDGG
jgi:hypothetical protein